ncbi:MAG TPA: hypothetical protein DD414_11880, partial [Lachnospiraceae bacterium]|nr:hypothetical protein [Lachnospiraceae bacterium]
MHILKNLRKIPFWTDYYRQDFWMRRRLIKLNRPDADFVKDEAKQQARMLKYCRRAFPDFYRFYGLDGSEALKQYPLISKHDMRKHPELFRTRYKRWIVSHQATTGGSTGTPFGFEISVNHDPVHQEFLWKQMGYKKGDRILCVNGMSLPESRTSQNIYYARLSDSEFPYGSYALSCLYLTEDTASYYFAFMEKMKPAYLRGYSSAIYRLAQYVRTRGMTLGFVLKGIQLTSETTFEYQIEYIEQVFHTKVYMQYGHTEAAVFAFTYDESHKYRCSPLYGHVEVLDEKGRHVREGETGEVVVTSYSNFAMPFIRYRTGDLAEYGGTKGAVVTLNKVWGRTQDIIYTVSEEPVFLTALIFGLHYHAFTNILKWKLIQKEYGKVIFRIVKGPEYTEKDETELRESFWENAGIE